MARARIRIEDFEDGVYPDVCASSGAEGGTRLYRVQISNRVRWVWLLVLGGPVGILAAVVLSGVLRKTASGYVPYTPAVQARLQQRVRTYAWIAVASAVVAVGSLLLGLSGDDGFDTLALLGVLGGSAFVLVALFLWVNPPSSVGGALDSTGRWIELDPVSARFAAAYEQQEARRRAGRRSDAYESDDVWRP